MKNEKRESITINVNPVMFLFFTEFISINADGICKNMVDLVGLTNTGKKEIRNIIKELQEKAASACYAEK
jgi:hypothetical protein